MSLLTFVLMFGLGFGECFSSGCNVYLVVDMAYGCALWGACTCNSEVSTFLRRTQKKLTQTVKVISHMGSGSTSNCMDYSEGPVFAQASVSWCFSIVMRILIHS